MCLYYAHQTIIIQRYGKRIISAKIAKEYQNRGLTEDELVAAGFEGLKKAAKKYYEKKKPNFKFESYAVWWIRQSIIQAIESKKGK